MAFRYLQGWGFHHLPRKPFPVLDNSFADLPWGNLGPFPLVLSLFTWERRLTPSSLQPPFRSLWRVIRFLLSFLFSD